MKVCVYAISKNEEKFVDRWFNSVKEADEIYVLDTGSTDNTVNKLKEKGIIVKQKKFNPFRFDKARNESLDMVPRDADVCICIDLDEVIENGWRKKLENLWENDTTRLRYNYNWSFDEYQRPSVNFYIEKIHSRNNYKWIHPVHEVLSYSGDNEKFITTDEITVNHYPDKNKSRNNYLPLLELSVKEEPNDDRNMHYLGREYMYYGRYNEAIDTLIKHLNMKNATWKDERCASMRFISRCYIYLGRYEEAKMWLEKAIKEAPHLRDPYVESALLYYNLEDWDNTLKYCLEALKLDKNTKSYINEPFSYDHTIYDLLSLCYFYKRNYKLALENVNKALDISPNIERLIKNKNIMEAKIEKENT